MVDVEAPALGRLATDGALVLLAGFELFTLTRHQAIPVGLRGPHGLHHPRFLAVSMSQMNPAERKPVTLAYFWQPIQERTHEFIKVRKPMQWLQPEPRKEAI